MQPLKVFLNSAAREQFLLQKFTYQLHEAADPCPSKTKIDNDN